MKIQNKSSLKFYEFYEYNKNNATFCLLIQYILQYFIKGKCYWNLKESMTSKSYKFRRCPRSY